MHYEVTFLSTLKHVDSTNAKAVTKLNEIKLIRIENNINFFDSENK